MSQPVVDAPVAVTVIDRRMIEASGAREIPELFRLVPGFVVGYHDGHTASVSYHMSDERYARRMQVLIDGRSVYTTAIGDVPWSTLDVTLDDIDRIEVVRGPNSASYGANSFLGVINIITRPALLDQGITSVKVNAGNLGVREVFLRHGGGVGKLDYRVSAGFTEDDGFVHRLDEKRTRTFSVRADYTLSAIDLLTFSGGMGEGPRMVENRYVPELSVDREKRELNHNENIKWERTLGMGESLTVQFYHIYNHNIETFYTGPQPLGAGVTLAPNFVDFGRRTNRYDLALQHNITLSDTLRAAWGGGVRDDRVWGAENMMGDVTINNYLKYGFMNLEWDSDRAWLLNAGAMVEDYSTTGTEVSPRLGINYRFSAGQSARLTMSKAVRTPAMFEYATDYGIYDVVTNLGPSTIDLLFWGGTRQTRVEKITSYEMGYHHASRRDDSFFDAKIFHDDLSDLIFRLDNPGTFGLPHDSLFLNCCHFVIDGFELEGKLAVTKRNSLYLGYAYTEMRNVDNDESLRMAPRNSVSMLYMLDFDRGYSAGVGYYFTDKIQGWESLDAESLRDPVHRLDLKVARKFDLHGHNVELALAARNVLGKYEEMEILRPKINFPELNEMEPSAYVSMKIQLD
jgi:iron complex outermembrane receptor protein